MRRIFSGRDARKTPTVFGALFAILVLHVLLLIPTYPGNIVPGAFLYLPVELPVLLLVFAIPLGRLGRLLRALLVVALSVITVIKIANVIAYLVFARPFNPVVDPSLVPIALETLGLANIWLGIGAGVAMLLLVIGIVALFVWTSHRLSAPGYRVAVFGIAFVLLAGAIGFRNAPPLKGYTVWNATTFVREQVANVRGSLAAAAQFKRDVAADPFRDIPGERLLTRLQGHDVLLIFVEAYGRHALEDPGSAPVAQLAASEAALRVSGYAMRSAWLVSPTFGGASWLAHGTFVTGLWIDDHQRYNTLFVSDYKTLISDFGRSGWRTVAVMPLFTRPWPEGAFFGYDQIYTSANLGYAGPPFGYITMPDQYVLSTFDAREMQAPGRKPIMLEMALNSSHLPWTPRPHFVPWENVGDGSVFATAREGSEFDVDWLDKAKMRDHYHKAISYTLQAVFSYLTDKITQPALVIVVGDHQPISPIAGAAASHDVPIHILSRDPALLESFEGWTDGLMPSAQSPIWKMDAMRGHILKAFSGDPSPAPSEAPPVEPVEPSPTSSP